jgi:hypothetical protein
MGEHLDMRDLLGAGLQKHLPIFDRPARAPGLEQILQTDADLALDAADGLLQHAREGWIRLVDPNRILQISIVIEHQAFPDC